LLNAIGGRGAEPGFGRGNGRRLGLAETHVQPRLAIGDVAAGQAAVPHRREEPASYPAGRDRQTTRPFAGPRRSPDSQLQAGYALLPSRTRRHFLILIDALFSSCLSRSKKARANRVERHGAPITVKQGSNPFVAHGLDRRLVRSGHVSPSGIGQPYIGLRFRS
jgi:hypothetical protein